MGSDGLFFFCRERSWSWAQKAKRVEQLRFVSTRNDLVSSEFTSPILLPQERTCGCGSKLNDRRGKPQVLVSMSPLARVPVWYRVFGATAMYLQFSLHSSSVDRYFAEKSAFDKSPTDELLLGSIQGVALGLVRPCLLLRGYPSHVGREKQKDHADFAPCFEEWFLFFKGTFAGLMDLQRNLILGVLI